MEDEKTRWELEKNEISSKYAIRSQILEFCVGGKVFTTYKCVVCKYPDSMLATLLSGRHPVHKDRKGRLNNFRKTYLISDIEYS